MKKRKDQFHAQAKPYEEIVRREFDTAVKSVRLTIKKGNGPKIYDLIGAIRKRREAAVVKYYPTIQERYANLYPDLELDVAWARENCAMGHSIDGIDLLYHISLGAAIFILDELKRTKQLGEAFRYFTTDEGQTESVYLPQIFDPCHEDEVLRGMLYLIHERDQRDNSYQWYINDVAAKRYEPENTDDPLEAEPDEMSVGQRFNAVMSLIRPIYRERAVQRFEEKMWEFLDRFFQGLAICDSKERKLQAEVDTLFEKGQKLREELERQRQTPNLLLYNPALQAKSGIGGLNLSGMHQPTQSLIAELESIAHRGLAKQDEADDANERKNIFLTSAHMLLMMDEEEKEDVFGSDVLNIFSDLEVDDPYEICFGYLCLIESGSDLPWLYNASVAVLLSAAAKLPWTVEDVEDLISEFDYDMDEDEHEETDEEATEESIPDFPQMEPLDWNEKKKELYALKYTQDVLGNEGEEVSPRKVNLPQLIFNLTGLVMPRTVSDNAGMAEEFERSGLPADAGIMMEYYMQLASDVQFTSKNWRYFLNSTRFQDMSEIILGKPEEADSAEAEQTVEELTAKLKELKAQKDELRQALYEVSKELSKEQAAKNKVLEDSTNEHQELIDLRQIVFDRQAGAETEQLAVNTIRFPAKVRHRIVVFGGHDTWLKAIKPMLPDVEFAGRDMRPNSNVIRNADIVWIQANAIAHKDYYKIIDVIRTNHIPVRYFLYASAEKCAVQVVEADRD